MSSTSAAFITIDNKFQVTRSVREGIRNDNNSDIAAVAESFMQTDEDRLEEAMEDLSNWFIVREDEEIILAPESNLSGGDRYYMLYVFACRVSSELDQRDSSRVSKSELMEYLDISTRETNVFIDKMDYWVDIYYREENSEGFHPFDEDEQMLLERIDPDDLVVELNDKYALEVVEYIRGEQSSPN